MDLKSVDPANAAINFVKLILISSVLWLLSSWKANHVPNNIQSTLLSNEPVQVATSKGPFEINSEGHQYQIKPVFDYELWGLIVSGHDSSGWRGRDHKEWGDFINTNDICVIWGGNINNKYLSQLKFSHGQWTCYVDAESQEAWASFNQNQLSNNHLIPSTPELRERIQKLNIGDEIYVKGQLVNYSIDGKSPRLTSITRDDRENGACEIVYVNELQVFNHHNKLWINLSNIGRLLTILGCVGFIFSLVGITYLKQRN